jgi:large subunit ribosomal protein L13
LDESTTFVYDAKDKVLGRLASKVAKQLLSARKSGAPNKVIIVNAEEAIVSGPRRAILADYDFKYKLNHPRKGPFFPRMPDQILKRTVRGMLPYQKNSSGRNALRDLRVMIGFPTNLSGDKLPEGHEWGDTTQLDRPLPLKYIRLGEISSSLGVDASRWNRGDN